MKTRDQIISENPLDKLCQSWGVSLKPNGKDLSGLCPIHKEKTPSFHVNLEKRVWNCFGCNTGGSVIDLVMKREDLSLPDAMRKLAGEPNPAPPPVQSQISHTYSYKDEQGEELFQVVRMVPKTFRQRHTIEGKWVWSMDGVRRVLYNLPKILKSNSPFIWIVEGEKDADSLSKLGFVSTTNVGGAGKWMDGYNDCLKGKEIILCGDNDGPGRSHVAMLTETLAKKAKTIRVISIPEPHKDVSDYVTTFNGDTETAAKSLFELFENAVVLTGGVAVPVQTMAELEREYITHLADAKNSTLNLSSWLPSFAGCVRGLVPGELVTILANTGVGKTAALQNIAVAARPIQTLLFELELPGTLTFERFASIATKRPSSDVMTDYNSGGSVDWRSTGQLDHINVCSRSRLSPDEVEKIILQTELKTGHRPRLVLLDYMGLIEGMGSSRYERVSHVAEQMKVVAKSTKTIIIIASQVSRKQDDDPEIRLSDGKDSGSIENSSGLVLGLWRESATLLNCKVLKNTKGHAGKIIQCHFNGASLVITEQPQTGKIDASDVPHNHRN